MEWLKKKKSGVIVARPENVYTCEGKWEDYDFVAITRNPVDRIKSGIQYWPEFTKIYREKGIEEVLKGNKRYFGVGFGDPIEQSNYDKYIKNFEKIYNKKVKVYKFEELIKDPDFPHVNESETKIDFTDEDISIISLYLNR